MVGWGGAGVVTQEILPGGHTQEITHHAPLGPLVTNYAAELIGIGLALRRIEDQETKRNQHPNPTLPTREVAEAMLGTDTAVDENAAEAAALIAEALGAEEAVSNPPPAPEGPQEGGKYVILIDCEPAMEAVKNWSRARMTDQHWTLVRALRAKLTTLRDNGAVVELHWTPGHVSGWPDAPNAKADALARKGAEAARERGIQGPMVIRTPLRQIKELVKRWVRTVLVQKWWTTEASQGGPGHALHAAHPHLSRNIPKSFRSATRTRGEQILLDRVRLNCCVDHRHIARMQGSSTTCLECQGFNLTDDANHRIVDCSRYDHERNALLMSIREDIAQATTQRDTLVMLRRDLRTLHLSPNKTQAIQDEIAATQASLTEVSTQGEDHEIILPAPPEEMYEVLESLREHGLFSNRFLGFLKETQLDVLFAKNAVQPGSDPLDSNAEALQE